VKNDFEKLKVRKWSQILENKKAWNDLVQKTNPMLCLTEEEEEEGDDEAEEEEGEGKGGVGGGVGK
jgi:hypothetical protein